VTFFAVCWHFVPRLDDLSQFDNIWPLNDILTIHCDCENLDNTYRNATYWLKTASTQSHCNNHNTSYSERTSPRRCDYHDILFCQMI
jgi:hypothetical protein